MKFEICGGLDAPDWLLAEIITLGNLSPFQIKELTMHILQHIVKGSFDYGSVLKLMSDSLDSSDIKSCISALHFLVTNAAKFDLDEETLSRELQQLGIPKEHTDSLCRPYKDNRNMMQERFLEQSIQLPASSIDGWQTCTGKGKSVLAHFKNNEFMKRGQDSFNGLMYLSEDKFRILLKELKMARLLMDGLV
ncbi:hypothetical protein SUGI_0404270 [Cryptomeria japonica]|uniref:uncharacterized protein LOC131077358 n=1 Tax=Cryptomeria japonica TaxID=3369 RepID=UPI002408A1E0|nr:uncharacterized protein LOC131077358 [Cryptomeria japonica]GLJ21696.1 hypothetical protein SUGI_0404270 [Cryptomeria japonica]